MPADRDRKRERWLHAALSGEVVTFDPISWTYRKVIREGLSLVFFPTVHLEDRSSPRL